MPNLFYLYPVQLLQLIQQLLPEPHRPTLPCMRNTQLHSMHKPNNMPNMRQWLHIQYDCISMLAYAMHTA